MTRRLYAFVPVLALATGIAAGGLAERSVATLPEPIALWHPVG